MTLPQGPSRNKPSSKHEKQKDKIETKNPLKKKSVKHKNPKI